MKWEKDVDKFVEKDSKLIKEPFLLFLKDKFEQYLDGTLSDKDISDLTIYWFSVKDEFSDSLIKLDNRIKKLSQAMDLTHPNFSDEKKILIIKELINDIVISLN